LDHIRTRLANGAIWVATARGLTNLFAFLSTLVLARLLTPADFGLVALATTMLAVLSALTELSLANALVHHVEPTNEHLNTAWSLNMMRGVLIGLLFCAIADPIASLYKDPRLMPIMIVLGLTSIMSGATNPKIVMFARNLVFRQDFILTVLSKFAGFLTALVAALIYRSYWALVIGSVTTQLSTILLSYLICPYLPRASLRHASDLWSYSVWLWLGGIVNTLNWKSDQLLIGGSLGPADLGYYTMGDNLAAMPTREATAPLVQTLFPVFARLRSDPPKLRRAYCSTQTFLSAVALPIAIGCALIAEPLVSLTMGEKWLPAVPVIQVLSCVYGLQTLSTAVQPLAMAQGRTRRLFGRDFLNLIIRLPTVIIGLLLGGITGIIYARAITGTVAILINMGLVSEIIGTPVMAQLAVNLRSLLSVAVMAFAVFAAERVIGTRGTSAQMAGAILSLIALGGAVYLGVSYGLWRFAGRPVGPELELTRFIEKLRDRSEAS
jgi:lipopolysaccharide exporter